MVLPVAKWLYRPSMLFDWERFSVRYELGQLKTIFEEMFGSIKMSKIFFTINAKHVNPCQS